jgi:Na+-translocating ferredoxin:NAD+ oxidoreductase subunit A
MRARGIVSAKLSALAAMRANLHFCEAQLLDYLLLFVSTALVNNMVLVKFLGLCPIMGVSKNLGSAFGMGVATTFVLTLSSLCTWLIDHLLLIPLNIEYLRILSFILLVAAVVQFTEAVMRKASPLLHKSLGIYLPLIVTNCAVLAVPLLNVSLHHNLLQSLAYAFGSSVGFTLVLVIFAGMRERLAIAQVSQTFAGAPIGLITAGLLSLIFMGFSGMI